MLDLILFIGVVIATIFLCGCLVLGFCYLVSDNRDESVKHWDRRTH
jgi:hypothetical protein